MEDRDLWHEFERTRPAAYEADGVRENQREAYNRGPNPGALLLLAWVVTFVALTAMFVVAFTS